MNDSNRIPPQNFPRRNSGGAPPGGRGPPPGFLPNNRGRGFVRGPPMGRGPPGPPIDRGRGLGPPRGRGPGPSGGRLMARGPPIGGRGYDTGRGNMPPLPPMPMNAGRGMPLAPPRGYPGRGIPPPPPPPPPVRGGPMMPRQQFPSSGPTSHFGLATSFNQQPYQAVRQLPSTTFPTVPQTHQLHQAQTAPQPYSVPIQQNIQAAQAPMSKQEIDKAWTEHTAPNNIKYYYNAITKESTYSKPEALVLASGGPSPTDTWVEYTDVTSGKKYYSNGVTTTWESPETFISHPEKVTVHPPEEEEPPQKKKKVSQKSIQFSSKAEAIAAFKGLLLAKDIQPTTKWNDVVKLCSPDPRWEACEVLTQGERKQALAEYQTKRANELRDSERQERVRAKEAFSGLLSEMLSNIESFNPATSRFADLRSLLSKDDRFHAVHDEATRESLFLEFCEEVRKRDERKKRNKRREAKESFLGFLREQEESGVLTFASTWSSFTAKLTDEDREDPRFQNSPFMSDSDRELYFSDFVIDLHAAEDEKRRRIRDARKRAEKAQREEYKDTLSRLAAKGTITPSSKWRNLEELLSAESAFGPITDHDREGPREIFQNFIDEWNETYRRDRTFLSDLMHPTPGKRIVVTKDMSYEDFTKSLLDQVEHSQKLCTELREILNHHEPVSSVRVYFDELTMRTRDPASADVRRLAKRGSLNDDSSEDEGEIIEEGEIRDEGEAEMEIANNNNGKTKS